MLPYAPIRRALSQIQPAVPPTITPSLVPPPSIEPVYTGYTGLPGVVETVFVLAILGSAGWVSIRSATGEKNPYARVAGWLGGIGSALFGVLYLTGKAGISQIPAVRVTPAA